MLATGQPGHVVASRGLLPELASWWAVVGVTSPCSALVSSVRGCAMTAPVPSRVAHPGLDTRPRIVQRFRGNVNTYYLDLVGGKFLCQRVDTHS